MEKNNNILEEDDDAFLESINALLEDHPQDDGSTRQSPPPRKPNKAPKKRRSLKAFWAILAAVAALALFAAVAIPIALRAMDPYDGKIVSDVSVGGVEIGGLTKKEAKQALVSAFGDRFSKDSLTVSFREEGTELEALGIAFPAHNLLFPPEETGASLDVNAAVDAAYALGRKDLEGRRAMSLLPYLGLNETAIRGTVDSYVKQLSDLYTEAGFTLQGTAPDVTAYDEAVPCQSVVLSKGYPGIEIDGDALYSQILDAYNTGSFGVEYAGSVTAKCPPELDLEALWQQTRLEPVEPSVDLASYKVTPGVHGYEFDLEEVQTLYDGLAYGESVTAALHYTSPATADEDAYFQDVLGHCETPHSDNENRNANLRKACELLDGTILQPGQELSYNQALGERTKEKGWLPAPAYSGTKLVDSPGGGICQVSSTLYLASVYAELTIVERRNHGYPVSYIPLGMDATVSWGFTDLKIRNDSPMPVKIHAEESDGYVRVSILGTETRDYTVEMSYTAGGRYVRTYMSKIAKETGELISKEPYALSAYIDDVY